MGLLEDLADETARGGQRVYPCTVCEAIEGIDDAQERAALAEATGILSITALIRISAKHQLGFNRSGILRHRREEHQPT